MPFSAASSTGWRPFGIAFPLGPRLEIVLRGIGGALWLQITAVIVCGLFYRQSLFYFGCYLVDDAANGRL
jgi:hypothetical protein